MYLILCQFHCSITVLRAHFFLYLDMDKYVAGANSGCRCNKRIRLQHMQCTRRLNRHEKNITRVDPG